MRHVSQTHRVDLDWLLHRINLVPGIKTNYINTNQQIAGIPTEGSFSREKWSQWTQLLNLMTPHLDTNSHFSVLFSSVQEDDTMSKRHAEPITQSATAKQRLVRNLSAYVKPNRLCRWRPR